MRKTIDRFFHLDLNKSIDIELISKKRTFELQRLLSMKMTEFLDKTSPYSIRRVLPGRSSLLSCEIFYALIVFLCHSAELDTIYRCDNENDNDEKEEMQRGVKINDYLSYNRFDDEKLLDIVQIFV